MAAEKESNIIFDFTWGNTYGLFAEGYHLMIKGGGDLYLTWSVDLKYGEVPLDNAKLDEFMKDLKALRLDTWNGKTYSDSSFENADTWRIEANHIALVIESKGANDYPPEWKQFLEYLHMKWSVPVSTRELPAEQRKEIRNRREKEEQESRAAAAKKEQADKKDGKKKNQNNQNNQGGQANNSQNKEKRDNRNNNKERQGGAGNRKKEQAKPSKDNNSAKEKDRRRAQNNAAADAEQHPELKDNAKNNDKPKKFRYHRKRNSQGRKGQAE